MEPFYPERIASKILGMGDLVGLIEKAQEHFDQEKAESLEEKIKRNSFSLADFQDQLKQIRKMGSLSDLMGMIPGVGSRMPAGTEIDESSLTKIDAIISSMTISERENPAILNGSRKVRVSKGSGTRVSDINRLLKQFNQMRKMMKKFAGVGRDRRSQKRAMQQMMGSGGFGAF